MSNAVHVYWAGSRSGCLAGQWGGPGRQQPTQLQTAEARGGTVARLDLDRCRGCATAAVRPVGPSQCRPLQQDTVTTPPQSLSAVDAAAARAESRR